MAKRKKGRGNRSQQPLISVAMIARNEESNLVRAVTSARRFADEIVVVDTGSTDRTFEVAAQLGCRVSKFTWIHDFAAARNESFRRCRGFYIWWQDPDEEVPEAMAPIVRELALRGGTANPPCDEFRFPTILNGTYRPPEEDFEDYGPGFRVIKPRMIRRSRDVQWRFRVHEDLKWARSIVRHAVFQT